VEQFIIITNGTVIFKFQRVVFEI